MLTPHRLSGIGDILAAADCFFFFSGALKEDIPGRSALPVAVLGPQHSPATPNNQQILRAALQASDRPGPTLSRQVVQADRIWRKRSKIRFATRMFSHF
jgi:hypothetical protein